AVAGGWDMVGFTAGKDTRLPDEVARVVDIRTTGMANGWGGHMLDVYPPVGGPAWIEDTNRGKVPVGRGGGKPGAPQRRPEALLAVMGPRNTGVHLAAEVMVAGEALHLGGLDFDVALAGTHTQLEAAVFSDPRLRKGREEGRLPRRWRENSPSS